MNAPGSLQESLHLDALVNFAADHLSLFNQNLFWLVPERIGFVIGMILRASKPAEHKNSKISPASQLCGAGVFIWNFPNRSHTVERSE